MWAMIVSFRNRGLRRLYEHDDRSGLNAEHVDKIRRILALLDQAQGPQDMDLPGFRLHPLVGGMAGFFSVVVRANWRIVFRFSGADASDVDYLDYH